MRLVSITLLFILLLSFTGLGVKTQVNQCTRDCIIEWCQPICGDDKLECRLPCMDDCEDTCKQCAKEKNCPADLLGDNHIAISKSHGAPDKGLLVTGTNVTVGDDQSGVIRAAVVPRFTRLNEALLRACQEGQLTQDENDMVTKRWVGR